MTQPQMSTVPRLRNPDLGLCFLLLRYFEDLKGSHGPSPRRELPASSPVHSRPGCSPFTGSGPPGATASRCVEAGLRGGGLYVNYTSSLLRTALRVRITTTHFSHGRGLRLTQVTQLPKSPKQWWHSQCSRPGPPPNPLV